MGCTIYSFICFSLKTFWLLLPFGIWTLNITIIAQIYPQSKPLHYEVAKSFCGVGQRRKTYDETTGSFEALNPALLSRAMVGVTRSCVIKLMCRILTKSHKYLRKLCSWDIHVVLNSYKHKSFICLFSAGTIKRQA